MVKVSLGTKGIDFSWADGGNPVKDPPKGLEPVGDSGWYTSPDVVDPRDCEFYPDSPWCGGNPIDLSLQVEVEINVDPCGITFAESGSALIKTPQFVQTYRFPGACRRKYEEPPPRVEPPPIPGADYTPPPFQLPGGFAPNDQVAVAIVFSIFDAEQKWDRRFQRYAEAISHHTTAGSNFQYPSRILYAGQNGEFGAPTNAICSVEHSTTYSLVVNDLWTYEYGIVSDSGTFYGYKAIDPRQLKHVSSDGRDWDFKLSTFSTTANSIAQCYLFEGRYSAIEEFTQGYSYAYKTETPTSDNAVNRRVTIIEATAIYCLPKGQKDYSRNPPPPPPEPRNCDCMQCCFSPPSSSPQQQDNELLKQILAECKKMNKALGSDEFPASFPQRLTGSNPGSVNIPNVAQLLKQKVIYLDELLGQYPVKIKIEDADPIKEGNQSEELEFGNTSELLAELFGAVMNIAIDSNVTVQLVTKALMEAGLIRKQVHTSQSHLEALVRHQGFELKEKTEDVPFTFSVPQTTKLNEFKLEDFCKESTQKVEVIEYKGKTTYVEDAAIIRHMHGIIKGVFFRGIAKDAASVAGEISRLLKKQGEAIDKISDNSEDGLENFIEDFERGFSSYTGGTGTVDPEKPFGLPYEQRPRVKIIKKPTTDNPGVGQ